MTVTLTMDATNSRVRLAADGFGQADTATVERSTDLVRWTTVRGGAAAAVPVGGLTLPGLAGSYASTPDNAALDIVGDIDLRAEVSGWTAGVYHPLIHKWNDTINQASYGFSIDTNSTLILIWTTLGTGASSINHSSTVTVPFVNGQRGAVRATLDVNNGAAGHTVVFYTAPTIDGPWVQLGASVVTGGVTSIFSGSAPVEIGTYNVGTGGPWSGTVQAAQIRNNIDGTVVANPVFWQDAATGAGSFADSAGRTWTVNGTAKIQHREISLDDYEFVPGALNRYRVRGLETGPITFVGVGAGATAVNASVTPALPVIAGGTPVPGDALVALASIRNSGAGTVNVPAGWTLIRAFGNVALIGRRYVAGDAAPTITFAGGVALADTLGQVVAFRRASIVPATGTDQLNGSAQNIAYPLMTVPVDGAVVIAAGWKQDDFTSVATLASPFAEIGEVSSTAGDDASQVWDYQIQTLDADITAASFVVTGGASAISRGAVVALPHADFLNEQIASLTPTLDRIWIKSITRPFLNRAFRVVNPSDVGRPGRGEDFDAVNRSYPIAVTELAGSRRWTLTLHVDNDGDAQTLDYVIASGDVLFVHTPVGCGVPGGYVRVAGMNERRPSARVYTHSRIFALSVVEVAAPGPDVVGAIGTWASVLAAYATWADVLAAFPTWADLLAFKGSPSEVIVP